MLSPILVDSTGRDGSTLMMRLLATSPEIAVPGPYPYEKKYFAYLWRWSRMLTRRDSSDWWTEGDLASLAHEAGKPLMGPPPWPSRLLHGDGATEPPMSSQMFEAAWQELSRRAADEARREHGDPGADVRYYAEKHQSTWQVDLNELPPVRVLVLLRDPRDVFVSFHSFDEKRQREGRGRFEGAVPGAWETEEDRKARFFEHHRQRLRWIAELPDGAGFPVFRYEDLVTDLRGQTGRLEEWLEVRLDPDLAAAEATMSGQHLSAQTPEASIGRWRQELPTDLVERFRTELGDELEALGYETGAYPN